MRQRAIYQQLLQIALDNDYTIEQVENATVEQVRQILGTDKRFSWSFFKNMKSCLIVDLQQRDDENDLAALKEQAKGWLDANFPDWQAERGRDNGKPYVAIWLKGKPEEPS